jgi:hypothetical protein
MQSQDGIQPDAHAYGAVMACLAKANMVQEALALLGVSTAVSILLLRLCSVSTTVATVCALTNCYISRCLSTLCILCIVKLCLHYAVHSNATTRR